MNNWWNTQTAEVQKWQKFYKESEESHSETKKLLHSTISENKRYREALEKIKQKGELMNYSTGRESYNGQAKIASKALEGEE